MQKGNQQQKQRVYLGYTAKDEQNEFHSDLILQSEQVPYRV
jgi:hypothetical protein